MEKHIKEFIQKHKQDINDGNWGKILKNILYNYDYDLDIVEQIFQCFKDAKLPIDKTILFKDYTDKFLNPDKMHQDFYDKITIENFPGIQNINLLDFNKIATNFYMYDFKDTYSVYEDYSTITIKGNKIYVVTDGSYIEFAIDLYGDEQLQDSIGTYYFYNFDLTQNLIVIEDLGIGANIVPIKKARDQILNHLDLS